MSAPVLLLDGASMWFRSFFGAVVDHRAGRRPVNAVRGFIDSIATLITQERPGRLVVCLDLDWRPQFRVDLIPSYKAHRVAVESPNLEFDEWRAGSGGSARRADSPGRHDHGAARRIRDRHRQRGRIRGRRRAGHTGGRRAT